MTLIVALPDGYEYVLATGVASVALTTWQTMKVGRARKRAGIKYPQMYAEKAEMVSNPDALKFNNVQRAHQNTLENYSQVLLVLFISGLKYPIYSSIAGTTYILGRVLYTFGYEKSAATRNARGGILTSIGMVALLGGAVSVVSGLVRTKLGL